MQDLETIGEMFATFQGCFDPKRDHLGLRIVAKYNAGVGFPARRGTGRDVVAKAAYERVRMKDPAKREAKNEQQRAKRRDLTPFAARLKKARLTKQVRMICHGRDIPEDVNLIGFGVDLASRMARMDLCFHLFVSRGWKPRAIAELLGNGTVVGDVCAWLSARGRNVLVDGTPDPG